MFENFVTTEEMLIKFDLIITSPILNISSHAHVLSMRCAVCEWIRVTDHL